MKKLTLTASAAVLAFMMSAPNAQAETVKTQTYVQTKEVEDVNQIDFSAFDVNKDGLYAKSEVGEKLFYVFDRDGNEIIDNLEWDRKSMYTIIPMEQETFRFVDYNDDGYTDLSTYTYQTFYNESGLIRFDEDKDGLSASEFIGEGFQSLDDNDNGMIDLEEWQEAYTEATMPKNAEQERYN